MNSDHSKRINASRLNGYIASHTKQLFLAIGIALLLVSYAYFYYLVRSEGLAAVAILFLGAYGIGVLICLSLFSKNSIAFEKQFLFLLITSGLAYMALFAPMKAPDEQSHFAAAYRYSNFLLGEKDAFGQDLFLRADDEEELYYWWIDHRDLSEDYHVLSERFSLWSHDNEMKEYSGSDQYVGFTLSSRPPQLHIIAALGITVARLLGLGSIPLIYFGRLFAFAVFVVCAYIAVKTTPVGKRAFAAIYLLPIVLQLSTSYSYDGPIISLATLYAAYFFKAQFSDELISRCDIIRLAVLAALLAPCKLIYSLLIPIVLFIPKQRFGKSSGKKVLCIAVVASTIASLAVISSPTIFSSILHNDSATVQSESASLPHNSSGAPTNPNYKPSMYLSDALADPIHAIGMAFNTAFKGSDIHIDGFFGGLMAWGRDLPSPRYIVLIFWSLTLAALLSESNWQRITPLARISSLALFCIGCAGVYASMLTGWTAIGSDSILGVQGRYFIPLFPLLIFSFGGLKSKIVSIANGPFLGLYAYSLFLYAGLIANAILGM